MSNTLGAALIAIVVSATGTGADVDEDAAPVAGTGTYVVAAGHGVDADAAGPGVAIAARSGVDAAGPGVDVDAARSGAAVDAAGPGVDVDAARSGAAVDAAWGVGSVVTGSSSNTSFSPSSCNSEVAGGELSLSSLYMYRHTDDDAPSMNRCTLRNVCKPLLSGRVNLCVLCVHMGTLDQSGLQVQFTNALFSEASFDREHLIASELMCAVRAHGHNRLVLRLIRSI